MITLTKAAADLLRNTVARAVKHNSKRRKNLLLFWDVPSSGHRTKERVETYNPLAEMTQ